MKGEKADLGSVSQSGHMALGNCLGGMCGRRGLHLMVVKKQRGRGVSG